MATKSGLEAGNSFDLSYPDGAVVDASYIDDFTREAKEAELKRLETEHFWPDKATLDLGDAIEVGSTGRHLPSSGRCDLISKNALQGSVLFNLSNKDSANKLGAIIRLTDDVSDSSQQGRVLYCQKETGTLCPLIKHLRGLIWVSGGFVFERLNVGMHNRLIGEVTYEDEDGVADGSTIGYNIYSPYEDPGDPSRHIWIDKIWRGNAETMAHIASSLETLIWELEDYGGVDKGTRVELSRNGFKVVSDLAAPPAFQFDGIKVAIHDHTGSDMGELIPYTGIEDTTGKRIHKQYEKSVPIATSVQYSQWTPLEVILASQWNDSGEGAQAVRELDINFDIASTGATNISSEIVAVVVVNGTVVANVPFTTPLGNIAAMQACTLVSSKLGNYMGSVKLTLPTSPGGSPAWNTPMTILVRPLNSLFISFDAGSTMSYIATVRRR